MAASLPKTTWTPGAGAGTWHAPPPAEADGPEQSDGWIAPGPHCQTGAGVLAAAYRSLQPVNFPHTLLAGQPDALLVPPMRAVYWRDWGDPRRILQTLRRFDQRPAWLPAYARALVQGAEWASADFD